MLHAQCSSNVRDSLLYRIAQATAMCLNQNSRHFRKLVPFGDHGDEERNPCKYRFTCPYNTCPVKGLWPKKPVCVFLLFIWKLVPRMSLKKKNQSEGSVLLSRNTLLHAPANKRFASHFVGQKELNGKWWRHCHWEGHYLTRRLWGENPYSFNVWCSISIRHDLEWFPLLNMVLWLKFIKSYKAFMTILNVF